MNDLWKTNDSQSSGGGLAWPDKTGPQSVSPTQSSGPTPTDPSAPTGQAHATGDPVAPPALPMTKGGYWDAKDARDLEKDRRYREEDIPAIRRNSSYTIAAQLASAALAGDALSFGSSAKGKRLDMFLDYVDLIAAHILGRLNGEVETAQEEDDTQEEVAIDE